MILKCECKHDSQDKLHGKGMRVFNKARGKGGINIPYRCTVCSKEILRAK